MTYQIGNKIWGLPRVDAHPESTTFKLVRILDRDAWSLQDIHEAGQMIEQNPVVKEVVLTLIEMLTNPNK